MRGIPFKGFRWVPRSGSTNKSEKGGFVRKNTFRLCCSPVMFRAVGRTKGGCATHVAKEQIGSGSHLDPPKGHLKSWG
eukprot:213015-Amphidinium_carterae.1